MTWTTTCAIVGGTFWIKKKNKNKGNKYINKYVQTCL